MGRCGPALFPGGADALGPHGQPDLLGELHAPGPGGPVREGITLYLSPNTNDNEEWQSTIRHIAIEGHCFFVNCDMVFTRDMYPAGLHCPEEIGRLPDIVCRGGSCVVDPYGHYVTQPVWDREAIICADLDLTQVPRSRMEFDGCGHYARPDVLKLTVDDR